MLTALITIDIPGIFDKKVIEHQADVFFSSAILYFLLIYF